MKSSKHKDNESGKATLSLCPSLWYHPVAQVINQGFIPAFFIHHLQYIPKSSPLLFLTRFLSAPCLFILTASALINRGLIFLPGLLWVSHLIFLPSVIYFSISYSLCIAYKVPLGLTSNPSIQSYIVSFSQVQPLLYIC